MLLRGKKMKYNKHEKFCDRILKVIENGCNKLPTPFTMFIELFLITAILSAICFHFNVKVINPANQEEIVVNNFLSRNGLTWLLEEMTTNFSHFASLGLVLCMTLGISLCEQVGLIESILKSSVNNIPKLLIPYVIAFLGTCGNIASDTCMVIIPPLSAVIFLGVGRNPVAGLMCGWLASNCGYSANLMVSGTDSLLAGITNTSIKILLGNDTTFAIDSASNWYFMFASTFLITLLIGWCTNHLLEPRVGEYHGEKSVSLDKPLTDLQRKGLKNARVTLFAYIIILLIGIVSGVLKNPETNSLIGSPFLKGLIPIILFMFILCGCSYGFTTGYLKTEKDVSKCFTKAMSSMGSFIAFCFAAGQFTALFNWTNLGTVLAIKGADFLTETNFNGPPLFVAIILIIVIVNLFMGSASAKWTVFGPVLVPMLMLLDYHPAWTQLLYRIGDSPSNALSPLSPFLFMCLSVVNEKYDKDMKLGSFLAPCIPTVVLVQIVWIIFTLLWYWLNLPLGPGCSIHMPQGIL